jgi:hypothetical protein
VCTLRRAPQHLWLLWLFFGPLPWSNAAAQTQSPIYDMTEAISPRMQAVIAAHVELIRGWLKEPVLLNAVLAANNKGQSMDDILAIDRDWQRGGQGELVDRLMNNKAGKFLERRITQSQLYAEAFLCDKQGAVVALYPRTTDYWQGDESKFSESFNGGQGQVHIDPLGFDESTQVYSVHVSVPVILEGQTVGVLIVGLRNLSPQPQTQSRSGNY